MSADEAFPIRLYRAWFCPMCGCEMEWSKAKGKPKFCATIFDSGKRCVNGPPEAGAAPQPKRRHGAEAGSHRWEWERDWVRPQDGKRCLANRCIRCGDVSCNGAYWTNGVGEPRAFAGRCPGADRP